MKYIVIIIIIFINNYSFSKGIIISGSIKDYFSLKPINNVLIIFQNKNKIIYTNSNNNGEFSLFISEPSEYQIEFSCDGYLTEYTNLIITNNLILNINLKSNIIYEIEEIKIKKEKEIIKKTKLSKQEIEASIKGGFSDPLFSILFLPGINIIYLDNSQPEPGVQNLSVRGGSTFENSIIFDNFVINKFFHNYYTTSVFIDSLINEIELYKGIVSSEYGQVMSSLLKVNSINNFDGFHGKINIGFLNSYISFYSDYNKNLRWLIGIQRVNTDLIEYITEFIKNNYSFNNNDSISNSDYKLHSWDFIGKLNYKSDYDNINFIFQSTIEPMIRFGINSNFYISQNNTFYTFFEANSFIFSTIGIAGINWTHYFWESYESLISLSYNFEINNKYENTLFKYFNDIDNFINCEIYSNISETIDNSLNLKFINKLIINNDFKLKVGYENFYYPLIVITNYYILINNVSNNVNYFSKTINGNYSSFSINSFFTDFDFKIFDVYSINFGLRLNYFDNINKYKIEPRINIFYSLDIIKLFFSYGILSKFPSDPLIFSYIEINEFDVPIISHYIIGFDCKLINLLETSLELYYKNYNNRVIPKIIENQLKVITSENSYRNIYGYDITIKKNQDKNYPVYGFITISGYIVWDYIGEELNFDFSYFNYYNNISQLVYKLVIGDYNYNKIPTSSAIIANPPYYKWFNNNSMDYKVNIQFFYEILKNLTFVANFNYLSGKYITPIIKWEIISINNNITNYKPIFGDYNSYKLPDSYQVNFGLNYKFSINELEIGINLQINNLFTSGIAIGYNYNPGEAIDSKSLIIVNNILYPVLNLFIKW